MNEGPFGIGGVVSWVVIGCRGIEGGYYELMIRFGLLIVEVRRRKSMIETRH